MGLTWRELDNPLRLSALLGLVGGVLLLNWTWPWLPALLSTPTSTGDSGLNLTFFVFVALALPFVSVFLLAGSSLLLFKSMSQERRGVLGFLLFILGGVPTYVWLYFYLALLYVYLFKRQAGS